MSHALESWRLAYLIYLTEGKELKKNRLVQNSRRSDQILVLECNCNSSRQPTVRRICGRHPITRDTELVRTRKPHHSPDQRSNNQDLDLTD